MHRLGALLGLVVAAQVPEPPLADVRWDAPADCPDGPAVAAAIEQRLGRPLAPGEATIDAHVTTTTTQLDARVELWLAGKHEVRTLTAASCAPLVEAVALVVAAAIRTGARQPAVPEPPAPASEPDATPVAAAAPPRPPPEPSAAPPQLTPRPAPPRPASPPRGPGWFLRLEAGPELGATPKVTAALGLAAGVLWRRFRLQLGVTGLTPRTIVRTDADIRAGLIAAAALGCLRTGRGRLEVPLCAGLEIGGMRGTASRAPSANSKVVPWVAALLGAGLAVRVHPRVALWSAVHAVFSPVRPRFELRGPEPDTSLLEPSPVSGRILAGVELRLADPR